MIIKPMIRNNICMNSHPAGCAKSVQRQIDYVRANMKATEGVPKLVLVIGCSSGYGLASRIAAAFGYGAATVGLSFERAASESKPGTPGFYNNAAFDKQAEKAGLVAETFDADAFSDEARAKAVQAIRKAAERAGIPAKVDLVIYSLASPMRLDPKTGVTHRSAIKPIGRSFSGKTVDMMNATIFESSAEAATEEEIAGTIKVMGGEDWELWMDALAKEGVLSTSSRSLAYTYLGPELSWAIYKNGTIGRAKEDLERACREINKKHAGTIAGAWVSVNKALVTRASAVIPIIPFYVSTLFKVMKEMGLHEGCIEQIVRLYKDRLYTAEAVADAGKTLTDSENRIRIDDWEMREDVQKETAARMEKATDQTLTELADVAGFRSDFMEVHGFEVPGVDYEADVNPLEVII
ncbi:MAG: trans-2-enoyl-CoA reductase family protein [Treponema sp.]|nr:trans-2-enoyl-CoA reductase family protein [Treponema sp.]